LIFPGWEPLDVYGPMEILYLLQGSYPVAVSLISYEEGPVSAVIPTLSNLQVRPHTVATHSLENAPPLDVLIAPGGRGVNYALDTANDTRIEKFIASRYESTPYVLSVCNGAAWLAKAGVLKGLRATTNKATWAWVTQPSHGEGIEWVPTARWIQNKGNKVWTSSGISAGIDMTYAFLKYLYGTEKVNSVMNIMEYTPHGDADWDSFSVVHNVPGADKNRSLSDCVAPAGIEPDCS
ncbi:class I glutamine amidotransferase-like protein, partial [Periconia macrospinosa]